MTSEDFKWLSKLFSDSDPQSVTAKLNSLDRQERRELAELLYRLKKRIFRTTLEPSINKTYSKIHGDIGKLFFGQIPNINNHLYSDAEKWNQKLATLRQIDLFAETSDFDLLNIAEIIEEVELKAHEPFLVQYKPVKGVYLLKESANVYEFNSKMPVISRSGIFGEDACATGELDSSITVKPVVSCKALFIPREKFVRLIRRVPGLQEKVFNTVVERAKQGSIRAEEHRKLTQEILDNIGQGSFSINVAGEIGENYTAIASDYLGTDNLAGVPFADLAFRSNREILRNYYRALHMLFSGTAFNHDVVLDLLPNEVSINDREFKLHYSFVQDGAGHVMSVFVRMEDITLQRELARKEQQEKAITGKMQSNVGGFMDMLDDVGQTLKSVKAFFASHLEGEQPPPSQAINEMMRALHGSKGLSGQFELNRLKQVIHQFEDIFLSMEHKEIKELSGPYQELLKVFEHEFEFAVSFKQNLGAGIIQILNGVSFSQDKFQELEQAAKDGDLTKMQALILSVNSVPGSKIVSNWKRDALRLAERLKKNIDVKIEVEETVTVPKEMAKNLNVNLGHLYRNCVDHGIETAEERKNTEKPETGLVAVSVATIDSELVLKISDDGRGIDAQKIEQLAKSNSHLDQTLVSEYLDQGQAWKVLFLPGFSSAKEVTDVSGRGVGLDAVQQSIEKLGGTIEVSSELGQGTEIDIRIPLN